MVTGWRNIGGVVYHFNQNGVLIERQNTENGWVQLDGLWYYYKEGVAVGTNTYNNLLQIGSKTYGFVDGHVASNAIIFTMVRVNGSKTVGDYFYVNANGELAPNAGWVQVDGLWYYIGADAKPYTGIHKIGGTYYSFRRAELEDGYPIYPVGSLIEGN